MQIKKKLPSCINLKLIITRMGSIILVAHGWATIFRGPRTLWVLGHIFFGRRFEDLWAFSSMDAGFRTWYKKIAVDYRTQGRFGFAWDDGLGMALGPRIYNNLATYALLGWMGTRNMALLSLAMFGLASASLVYLHFGSTPAFLFAVISLVSPMFVGLHTHIWKAEFFWWGAGVMFCYLALGHPGLAAGLLWSLIAMVNLPASVMLALFTAPVLLVESLNQGCFALLVLGVLPGLIKHSFRIYSMWRSGFLPLLVGEQSRLWKRPWYPIGSELVMWIPFLMAVMAGSYSSGHFEIALIVASTGIFLYWANFRLIYFNDVESIHFGYWALGLSMACLNESWPGLAAMLIFAYASPALFGFPASNGGKASAERWVQLTQDALARLRNYPSLEPIPYPLPRKLHDFFDLIPHGARILAESDGDPRSQSRFRVFWCWSEGLLPLRKIDLVNEMYTRMNEPDLVDNILLRFNGESMSPEEMIEISTALGVSYIVCWSDKTIAALSSVGYIEKGFIDLEPLREFRSIITCPPVKLHLLESPRTVGVIAPAIQWSRKSNELVWLAELGKVYKVLYRYDPHFIALQGGEVLSVGQYAPFPEVKLRFMYVTAISDGPLILRFSSGFFG